MKKRFLSLGLAAVMAMSLTACGGSNTAETTKAAETTAADAKAEGSEAADTAAADAGAAGGVFKIGGIGPVTGGAAVYGVAVQHGAELAVKEINEAGGINGAQIEFNFQDDEHDAEKSVNAYNTLKDWGMQVLMGTVTSAPCIAVADKTAADNMFQITPSGSAVECAANPNVFRICFSDPDQGAASAKYIGENKLASKVAVIYDSSDVYSSGIYERFEEEAAVKGLEIVSATTFTDASSNDFSVQLTEAKNAGADLLFLPIYYQPASLILQQASDMGYTPKIFGVDGMDGILTLEGFDTSLAEGVMLLTPFNADATDEKTQNFVTKYQELYGEVPNQFAADAYDCVYAYKAALEASGATPDMDAQELCELMVSTFPTLTFDGLTGEGTSWDATGAVSKSPKGMVIENGAYVGM